MEGPARVLRRDVPPGVAARGLADDGAGQPRRPAGEHAGRAALPPVPGRLLVRAVRHGARGPARPPAVVAHARHVARRWSSTARRTAGCTSRAASRTASTRSPTRRSPTSSTTTTTPPTSSAWRGTTRRSSIDWPGADADPLGPRPGQPAHRRHPGRARPRVAVTSRHAAAPARTASAGGGSGGGVATPTSRRSRPRSRRRRPRSTRDHRADRRRREQRPSVASDQASADQQALGPGDGHRLHRCGRPGAGARRPRCQTRASGDRSPEHGAERRRARRRPGCSTTS